MASSSEKSVVELLTQWDLEIYIPEFQEHEVGVFELLNMKETEYRQILKKVGPLTRFETKRDEYKASLESENLPPAPSAKDNSQVQLAIGNEIAALQPNPNSNESVNPTEPTEIPRNDVYRYLDRSVMGKELMKLSQKGQTLKDADIQILTDIIIDAEMKGNSNHVIKPQRLTDLAVEATQVIPTALKAQFYIERKPGPPVVAPKGKLYGSYEKITKKLRNRNLRTINQKRQAEESIPELIHEENDEKNLEWLVTGTEPWSMVKDYWNLTFEPRRAELLRPVLNGKKRPIPAKTRADRIVAYTSKVKAFTLDSACELLEIDCERLYPGTSNKLFEKWPNLKKFIIEEFSLDFGSDDLSCLQHFPKLFGARTVNGPGQKRWRVSKAEIQAGFLLTVETLGELENAIQRLREKAASVKRTLQPFPAVVKNVTSGTPLNYVVIDSLRYKTESPLKAIDVCFKSYHALHAEYPVQSEPVWLLLQKVVYEIETVWDSEFAGLAALINRIKL